MRMPHDTMGTGAPHACSLFYLKCGPLICASACMASCTIASIHASGLDHHMHERSPHPNLKLNPDPLPQPGERCAVCGRTLGLCVFCATASSTASVAAIRDPHANGRHAPTPNARPYATLRSHPAPARSDPTQPKPTQYYPTRGCLDRAQSANRGARALGGPNSSCTTAPRGPPQSEPRLRSVGRRRW